jgi:hypothetical protein
MLKNIYTLKEIDNDINAKMDIVNSAMQNGILSASDCNDGNFDLVELCEKMDIEVVL